MFILLAQLLTYCTSSVGTISKLLPVSYKELGAKRCYFSCEFILSKPPILIGYLAVVMFAFEERICHFFPHNR